MTWAEFNAEVRVHLSTHNRRQGIQTFIDTLIKAATVDLQSAIPELRTGHTTVYLPARFVTDGFCGKAHYQKGALITSAYARDPDDHSLSFDFQIATSESDERQMVEGLVAPGVRLMSVRPALGVFRVVPNPAEDLSEVVLVWNGVRSDFEEDDDVPFDATVALVAADFVLARLARRVDGDIDAAKSYHGTYTQGKRRIKSDWNEATNVPARAKRT